MKEKRDFFVSYNKEDKQWAKWIAAVLVQEGYTCYLQAWDFRPSGNFVLDMHNALVNSDRFIAVLSQDYLDSEYCQPEWAAAFTQDPTGAKKLLIPVRVADVKPQGLLSAVIYIDLYDKDEATAEKLLIQGVDTGDIPKKRPAFPGKHKEKFPEKIAPRTNLPFRRNEYFTGREEIFRQMRAGFESGESIALTQTLAGIGGLGKTNTALEYAYRYAHKYEIIWWVAAESEITISASYRKFAESMELITADVLDDRIVTRAVITWLESNDKWLFIYDNVEDIADDTPWLPKGNSGNMLITTRNNHLRAGKRVEIDVFAEDEAVAFLEGRTGRKGDLDNALTLAKRLGCLPLALEQAAAYIHTNGISYADYVSLFAEYGLKMLDDMYDVRQYTSPITTTTEISIDKIDMPEARQLLNLCAYLAPEDIDKKLFSNNAELFPPQLQEIVKNRLTFNNAWRQLTRYSLIKRQDDREGYAMHRLVQEIVRRRVGDDGQWALCWLGVFYQVYKLEFGNVESHDAFMKLTPHVEAFLGNAGVLNDDEDLERVGLLYNEGGVGLSGLGHYDKALVWKQSALDVYIAVFGAEHQVVAIAYNNMGIECNNMGDYPRALELCQKALVIKEKVLGPEHPSTATTYNNMAQVYRGLDDNHRALELYKKTLAIDEKVFGQHHKETAVTYNNMAIVYHQLGDYTHALELHQKALTINEDLSGPEHPDTASTYNNMALVYANLGDYSHALELLQKSLAIREKVLGIEHPHTHNTRNNIAAITNGIT